MWGRPPRLQPASATSARGPATGDTHACDAKPASANAARIAGAAASAPAFDASLGFEMLNFMGRDAAEGAAAIAERRKPDYPSAQ